VRIEWDERQVQIARMALLMLSYGTDTGTQRAEIAVMLASLDAAEPRPGGIAGALTGSEM